MLQNIEKSGEQDKNVFKNGWWIQTPDFVSPWVRQLYLEDYGGLRPSLYPYVPD